MSYIEPTVSRQNYDNNLNFLSVFQLNSKKGWLNLVLAKIDIPFDATMLS